MIWSKDNATCVAIRIQNIRVKKVDRIVKYIYKIL